MRGFDVKIYLDTFKGYQADNANYISFNGLTVTMYSEDRLF